MKWYVKHNPNAYSEKPERICPVCGEKAVAAIDGISYCNKHYQKMRLYGNTESGRKSKNTYKTVNNVAYVQTTKGDTFIIDESDLSYVLKYSWCISKTGYVVANVHNKVIKLQRYLLSPDQSLIVDHINGNPLDNRRKNLRICNAAQNARNTSVSKTCKSGYLGIRKTKNNTYNVRIVVNRKEIHLGNYGTLKEAQKARKDAEKKYFGEYAPSLSRHSS